KSFLLANLGSNGRIYYCPDCKKIVRSKADSLCACGKDLSGGYSTNKEYACPSCGIQGDLTTAWLAYGKPPEEEIFAIEYNCKDCGREFKTPDDSDISRFEEAKTEFIRQKNRLMGEMIPDQHVPWDQMATMRPRCLVYEKYHQFFNERQLFSLALIMEEILKIDDMSLREFFALTFSDALNANNMFCIYNTGARKLEPLFGGHYFSPPTTPVENNVWGGRVGRGTFRRYFLKGLRALNYQSSPYEIRFSSNTGNEGRTVRNRERVVVPGDRIDAEFADTFTDFEEGKDTLLVCASSEDLGILPDNCVDAVVTDPPYYDNIMYSELSEFFYVWLQKIVPDSFQTTSARASSADEREILVHSKIGKGDSFFVDSMTRVYTELNRVLKDDGLLTFVFQHKRPKAWSALLRILTRSEFQVAAMYPTHGETPSGVRAHGMNYNTILVCRKGMERTQSPISMDELRDRIRTDVFQVLIDHPEINETEALVLAMGKALQICTQVAGSIDFGREDQTEEHSMGFLEDLVRESITNHYS
ncbi:MAG: hypothetical protein ACFFD9_08865, partial [Candidatus Thorarchaeota archaeon]